jgi:hypothetical protein
MQQRPTGITILAILAAIGGVFDIIGGLALAGLGGLAGAVVGSAELGGLAFIWGGIMFIVGGIWIAIVVGFWLGKPWAWPLAIIMALVGIGVTIAQLVTGYTGIFSALLSIVIPGIILYYLNQPVVKKYFGR